MKLNALHRFTSTATAVEDITALQEGKLGPGLKKFLTDEVVDKGKGKEGLVVAEPKLGGLSHQLSISRCTQEASPGKSISKLLKIKVKESDSDADSYLWRGIRSQVAALLDGLDMKDLNTMSLGLAHSLSRSASFSRLCTSGD